MANAAYSSARGYLNQVFLWGTSWFGRSPQPIQWLESSFWAPVCVVLPTLRAGIGMGSLICLAALKSVPDDM